MSSNLFQPVTGFDAFLRVSLSFYVSLLSFLTLLFFSFTAVISSKCCTSCAHHLPLSSFFKDLLTDSADPTARVYAMCILCRTKANANKKKRTILQALDPNIQPAKHVCRPKTCPQESALPSNSPP